MTKLNPVNTTDVRVTVTLLKHEAPERFTGRVIFEDRGVISWIPLSGTSYSSVVKLARSILVSHGIDADSVGIYTYVSAKTFLEHKDLQTPKALEPRGKFTALEFKARIIQADSTPKELWFYNGYAINRVYMRFEGYGKARFKVAVLLSDDRTFSISSLQFGEKPPAWLWNLIVKAFAKSK